MQIFFSHLSAEINDARGKIGGLLRVAISPRFVYTGGLNFRFFLFSNRVTFALGQDGETDAVGSVRTRWSDFSDAKRTPRMCRVHLFACMQNSYE